MRGILVRVVHRPQGGDFSRGWILSRGLGQVISEVPADAGLPKMFRKEGNKGKQMLQTSASPFC